MKLKNKNQVMFGLKQEKVEMKEIEIDLSHKNLKKMENQKNTVQKHSSEKKSDVKIQKNN